MKVIEKNESNIDDVNKYFEDNLVLFEHTILESKQFTYSICYCPVIDIYDVVLEDTVNSRLINFESRRKLSGSTLKYFNVYKDDVVCDMFGNEFKCQTHHIELKY